MTNFIPLDSIVISENRQRREFDPAKITELANSISARGLLHPPIIRDGFRLVAGERRLRAIRQLAFLNTPYTYAGEPVPPGLIPVNDLGEIDPLEAEEAELEENTVRLDLSWQERAQADARLHALRERQTASRGEVQTIAQTAEEIHGRGDGGYAASVRENVIVAKHLDKPEVAKAKSAKEAMKILKVAEKRERDREVAATVGTTATSDRIRVIHGNCIEVLQGYTDSFDCIIADPPYGINAQDFGDSGGRTTGFSHIYDDSPEAWRALMTEFVPVAYDALASQGHMYLFCDLDRYHELKALCEAAGFYVLRTPLIYHKPNNGRVPVVGLSFRRTYEFILFANKGKKPVEIALDDVVSTRSDNRAGESTHGASKTVEGYSYLLRASCRPGDRVCDPFAGSGTILHAAHAAKLYAWAIEQDEVHYGHCVKTLETL
jgi:adenine-specific DNA-methyltransferase